MTGQVLTFPARWVDGDPWEPYVDERTIARYFGVSERTIRRWRSQGMPGDLKGGARRYKIGLCEQWHERRAS